MTCYHPIQGYRSNSPNPDTGKYYFTMKTSEAYYDCRMQVPCGRCIGCRIQRSKEWAIRCYHEAQMYEKNSFITLTYNEKYNPKTLTKDHFPLFMKRLRKAFVPTNPHLKGSEQYKEFLKINSIRFFQCGEYGEVCKECGLSRKVCYSTQVKNGKQHQFIKDIGRPHHHACLFNFDFEDKELWQVRDGVKLYRSPTLERLWSEPESGESYGFSTIGEVTFESAAYVARYILKKYTNKNPEKVEAHYSGKIPEYTTMSRRPGIGKSWFQKYGTDVYPADFVLNKKLQKLKPPRYYDKLFDLEDPKQLQKIKGKRIQKYITKNITPEKIRQSEEILTRKIKKLKREVEV